MISYENAIRLKQSGFPQPEKELDQRWFDSKGGLWYIGTLSPRCEPVAISLRDTRWEFLHDTTGFVYAPTALEILREIDTYVTDGLNIFRVDASGKIEASVFINYDLDDAAAMCWLEQEGAIETREVKYLTGKGNCPDYGNC